MERYINLSIFPEDRFRTQYIQVEEKDGKRREGIGLIVEETSAQFIPRGSLVYAIIAEYGPTIGEWTKAKNPF